MTEALRRLLWLVPVLAVGAVLVFLTMASTRTVQSHLPQPLFYNSSPKSAQTETQKAVRAVISGKPEGPRLLAELGGAALPTLLSELPSLTVQDRRALADALAPVSERMRPNGADAWGTTRITRPLDGVSETDQKLLFWERYRDEHALDLRPLSASRLVKRMAQRDTSQKSADLLALDTYALPTLVERLGRIKTQAQIDQARRIVAHVSWVTGHKWQIPESANAEGARRVVTQIRAFWDREGAKWTQLDRFQLLVARFSQTEFAGWISRTLRALSRVDQQDLLQRLSVRARITAPLLLFSLLGLLVLGPAVAATLEVIELSQKRFRLKRVGMRLGLATGVAALIPLLLRSDGRGLGTLSFLALVMGASYSTFLLQRELRDRLDWRTHHVLRTRGRLAQVSAVTRWLAPSIPTMTPIAVAEAAVWVTCLEVGASMEGVGAGTLSALRAGDLDWLMAICLGLGALTGTAQVVADMLLGGPRQGQAEV